MSFVGDLIGDVFGGITGAKQAGEAAEQAGRIQAQAVSEGIAEQRRQFDKLVELLAPYISPGVGAIGQQQALIGLQGPQAQQQAISGFEQSPIFQALTRQGEEAILQRASATGGLRGGNVQAALSQFRPQVLNALIEQQYNRLGGLSSLGLEAALGQGEVGMSFADSMANLLANRGASLAGGQLATGYIPSQTVTDILNIGKQGASALSGLKKAGFF